MGRLKPGGGARKRGDRELYICSVELNTKHIIDQCSKLTRERSRIQPESAKDPESFSMGRWGVPVNTLTAVEYGTVRTSISNTDFSFAKTETS